MRIQSQWTTDQADTEHRRADSDGFDYTHHISNGDQTATVPDEVELIFATGRDRKRGDRR